MKHFFKAIMLSIITLFLYSANPLLSYSGTLDTSLNNYLPDSSLNLKSTQLYIEPQAELSFNSSYITFQSVSGYIQEWLPSVTFADDTSILTFNNCNVNFSQGDLSYSNTLTFTAGTININGQVNFTTDRTAGYKIMIGDGTVAGDLALQFGPLSRLKIGSNIDFQLRPSK